jgi:hypothetical protein
MKARVQKAVIRAKGQVLILMALLMTTLIIFFGMVVNIGHLVQAKINLQNAVDLAAMAGASWQARYLNHLALINYRMRQNYKFVLFDIYVTQSRHNQGFQEQVTRLPGSNMNLGPIAGIDALGPNSLLSDPRTGELALGICQTIPGFHRPPRAIEGEFPEFIGVSDLFSVTTDFCRLIGSRGGRFTKLPEAPPIPFLPMSGAISAAQANANRALRENCEASAGQNGAYFNYIIHHLRNRNDFQMREMANVLLNFNRAFSKDPDGEMVGASSQGEGDQSVMSTFLENLITANRDGVRSLTYLNPPESRTFVDDAFVSDPTVLTGESDPSGNFTKYFERQRVGFTLTVINSEWDGGGCSFKPVLMKAKPSQVFLGLSRARTGDGIGDREYRSVRIPFQVTLRATVQPSLLFWPRGLTPTLVAVSSAKPFGGRIAPPIENVTFEVSGTLKKTDEGQPANMSFYPGDVRDSDAPSRFPGVGHKRILKYLESLLRYPGGGMRTALNTMGSMPTAERPSIIDSSMRVIPGSNPCNSNPMPFLCAALMPTLYEGLLWTVFPDPAQSLASNPAQVAEYPYEHSLPIGGSGDPDVMKRLQIMENLYLMPDRMRLGERIGNRTALWHVSTLPPREVASVFANEGKPLFYANETSAASAFNPDWDPKNMDTYLANATDGRRGYQIRLISMQQACEELGKGDAKPASAMEEYCREESAVFQ